MKKVILILCFVSASSVQPFNGYKIFDSIGSCADFVFSKGQVSGEDEKLFAEVAVALGIEDRDIKIRNAGLLLRLAGGYNNASAVPLYNRVYINTAFLKELSQEEKRFLMAHELAHHQKHHVWKLLALYLVLQKVQSQALSAMTAQLSAAINSSDSDFAQESIKQKLLIAGGIVGGGLVLRALASFLSSFSGRRYESEADALAICQAGAITEDGIRCLEKLYYPDTTNWPTYAKMLERMKQANIWMFSLPVLKYFATHPSLEERVEHLQRLA